MSYGYRRTANYANIRELKKLGSRGARAAERDVWMLGGWEELKVQSEKQSKSRTSESLNAKRILIVNSEKNPATLLRPYYIMYMYLNKEELI